MQFVSRMIASGFGSGFAPVAPGTVGSLAALGLGALMLVGPGWVLPFAIVLATLAGLWAIGPAGGGDDPGWVTIDEFAGQWVALLPLASPSPLGLAAAFVLFRLFDITKPGPVGWADRQHGAAGVMADDLIAGGIAAAVIWGVQRGWPSLLSSGLI
jgi:phosphatidylglycerophosphatase A